MCVVVHSSNGNARQMTGPCRGPVSGGSDHERFDWPTHRRVRGMGVIRWEPPVLSSRVQYCHNWTERHVLGITFSINLLSVSLDDGYGEQGLHRHTVYGVPSNPISNPYILQRV